MSYDSTITQAQLDQLQRSHTLTLRPASLTQDEAESALQCLHGPFETAHQVTVANQALRLLAIDQPWGRLVLLEAALLHVHILTHVQGLLREAATGEPITRDAIEQEARALRSQVA